MATHQDSKDEQQPLLTDRNGSNGGALAAAVPTTARATMRRIAGLAGPLMLQNVFSYALSVIAAVAVGQLNDPVVLSSVVLASSFYNVTGLSLIVGLSAGCDTIAGQAYGAGNYLLMGETLQRAVLICSTMCGPIMVLWSFAGPLMLALHQAPDIVAGAVRYLQIVSPSLLLSAVSGNINKYLTAQGVVQPGSVCTAITALLCPLYNWITIYKLGWGLEGAAAAFLASNATYTVLMVGVVAVRHVMTAGTAQHTWPGFTLKAFARWGSFLDYGLPAAAMVCCEWWVFELVILMAGSLPDADVAVAVMGISFHVTAIAYMLPMSVATAVNTGIANSLGAGVPSSARMFCVLGTASVACLQATMASALFVCREQVARLFTGSREVVADASHVMPVVVACIVSDGLNSLFSGVLRGAGRQAWGAALNLIGYWCVGFPLAIVLGFKLGLDTWGFWAALAAASNLQACIQLAFISRINWNVECARAADLVDAAAKAAALESVAASLDVPGTSSGDERPVLVVVQSSEEGGGGAPGDGPSAMPTTGALRSRRSKEVPLLQRARSSSEGLPRALEQGITATHGCCHPGAVMAGMQQASREQQQQQISCSPGGVLVLPARTAPRRASLQQQQQQQKQEEELQEPV